MAVIVQCFHCNAILELDDGFRGGVCRCSTCGSLLQVPQGESDGVMPRKRKTRPPKPLPCAPAPSSAGTRLADPGLSSGQLDPRRTDIGVSSGLGHIHPTRPIAYTGSSRRHADSATSSPPRVARTPQSHRLLFWWGLVLAALVIALAMGLGAYYLHAR
jgi:hypothetical protein